jgi:hypothetical protein
VQVLAGDVEHLVIEYGGVYEVSNKRPVWHLVLGNDCAGTRDQGHGFQFDWKIGSERFLAAGWHGYNKHTKVE